MIFIRHGESEANILNIWGGDYSLTDKGRQQASAVKLMVPSLIIVSGLKRAWETADIVFPGMTATVDTSFNEIHFGDIENTEIDFDGDIFRQFISEPGEFHKLVNGDDITRRAKGALEAVKGYPADTVFFTHGILMQAMRSLVINGTVDMMHDLPRIDNCEIWRLGKDR